MRRIKAVDLSRECTWNPLNNKSDPAKFLRYVMGENLPQWVSLSDWDNAPFLQALLTTMWPGINNELSNLLRKILQSEASHILTINKLDLGKRPVTLYGVKVLPVKNKRDTTKIESLVVLLDLRWGGEPDVSITVKVPKTGGVVALNAGMRNLEVRFPWVFAVYYYNCLFIQVLFSQSLAPAQEKQIQQIISIVRKTIQLYRTNSDKP